MRHSPEKTLPSKVLLRQIVIVAAASLTLLQCGRKSHSDDATETSLEAYLPADWDGTDDYSDAKLGVK